MPTMKLHDVSLGVLKNPRKWSNEQQKHVDLNPLDHFLNRFKNKNLQYVDGNIHDGASYHRNYMEYLEKCWAEHLGIIITPDIVWQILLCQLAEIIKENPEQYRNLFSEKQEKQEITIISGDPVVMPLSVLVEKLKDHVPTDTNLFMPEFTTSNPRSHHAFRAAFCDMCSPYYSYSMCMCGFPCIDVRGTDEDWNLMLENWSEISKFFNNHKKWFGIVYSVLENCLLGTNDSSWWRQMFELKSCGSGHDVIVGGWLKQLFQKQPDLAYPNNFSSCISIVDYKQLDFNKNYSMMDGLFSSRMNDDCLVPEFGFMVFEKI